MPLTAPIDVNLPEDPAIVAAGPDAEHLFIRSILLAKRIMTDGVLHRRQALRCAQDLSAVAFGEVTAQQLCDRLVQHGLWTIEGDNYVITAWLTWNKPADEIREKAKKEAERKARHRDANATRDNRVAQTETRRGTDASSRRDRAQREGEGEGDSESERESTLKRAPTPRGTRVPDPFVVTEEMRTWAETECPNVDWTLESKKFKDHWIAQPGAKGVKLNWNAVWRNWMRRAQEGAWK